VSIPPDSIRPEKAPASPAAGARVVLYGKPGCHLCEDMRALVDAALEGTGLSVTEVDITRDLEIFMRLRHDVPVLEIDGREVARHRITEPVLSAALRAAGVP
jgi:glutaredoxin